VADCFEYGNEPWGRVTCGGLVEELLASERLSSVFG
jgi:hypothetical protein